MTGVDDGAVRFTGANRTFRTLVIRGALLELVTFGFYRFWLVTDIRRHLWANTEVDGVALEYTGRGKELLLGFLFALAILVPVFIGYTLLGLAVEQIQAFGSFPLYAFLYAFGQFAIFRARRYRLTRTIWRGVRFWMTGSGWSYAWRSLLWLIPVFLTLGLAYPWRAAALERFKMRHTRYGTLTGGFVARGGTLFRRVWWIWLLGLLPAIAYFGSISAFAIVANAVPKPSQDVLALYGALIGVSVLVGAVTLPFLHALRIGREWQWWLDGLRIGGASLRATIKSSSFARLYWTVIGLGMLMVVVATVIVVVIGGLGSVVAGGISAAPAWFANVGAWLAVPTILLYLSTVLSVGVIMRIYLQQRVWKLVAESCTLIDAEALADVAAAGVPDNALGEGLADGLDVAGF